MSNESRTIVLASRNEDKLREMRQICADSPFKVVSCLDYPGLPEIIEDGTTALGNASRKALAVAAYTGEIAVADDTSFQIRILGGVPDIFASRLAGPDASYADNVDLALDLMATVPDEARDARFETSTVWVDPRPMDIMPGAAAPSAEAGWLRDPRAVGPARPADPEPRRRTWHDYLAMAGTLSEDWGVDTARVRQIAIEHVAPFLAGGRPTNAAPDAILVPEPRQFLLDGPADRDRSGSQASLATLPDGAPGRTASLEPVWFTLVASGRLVGQLGRQPLGMGGFGYDPIFVPTGHHRTMAELAPDEKNAISHRARALRRLMSAAARVYSAR